jgi:hypothetical protein
MTTVPAPDSPAAVVRGVREGRSSRSIDAYQLATQGGSAVSDTKRCWHDTSAHDTSADDTAHTATLTGR